VRFGLDPFRATNPFVERTLLRQMSGGRLAFSQLLDRACLPLLLVVGWLNGGGAPEPPSMASTSRSSSSGREGGCRVPTLPGRAITVLFGRLV
jgi:hypothetical protein